jgi:protocatechuate 3,4-dioxygenase beta subunit
MGPNRKRLLRLAGVLVIAAAIPLALWSRRSPVQPVHRRVGPPRLTELARSAPAAGPPAEVIGPAADAGASRAAARDITLRGRVLDAGGGVIGGARVRAGSYVRLADDTHEKRAFEALTDGEGRYQLKLPAGRHQLMVEADGYGSAAEWRALMGDQTRDFALQPAARIAGRVVRADSRQPVAGARVSARRDDRPLDPSPIDTDTDDQGRFRLASLPPGAYRVSARADGLAGALDRSFTLGATDALDDVELLVAPTLTIHGQVTSVTGTAIPHARIVLSSVDRSLRSIAPGPMVADTEGQYLIEGVMPGRYRFGVTAQGHASHSERLAIEASVQRDVVLQQPAVVTGLVLHGDGRPAARAWVVGTVGPPNVCRDVAAQTLTDADGRFSLVGLGAGELTLKATHEEQAAIVGPELLQSRARKQVTIRLGAGAVVTGVARWDDGSPIASETIMIVMDFAETSRMHSGSRTGPDGSFTIRGLPPGEVTLQVVPRGRANERLEGIGSGRAMITLKPGEQRSGVELIVARS